MIQDVSVILPYYNAGRGLQRAIDSIVGQSRGVREIIIVDDGSTQVAPVLEIEVAVELRRLSLEKNMGPATARNRGAAVAKGRWLAFLDADEIWSADKVARQIDFLESHPEYVLCGTLAGREGDEDRCEPVKAWREIAARELLWRNPFRTSSVLMLREVFPGFPDGEYYSEDFACWQQALFGGSRAAILNEVLTFFDRTPGASGGLSAHGRDMLAGEYRNFVGLVKQGHINWGTAAMACLWATLKFLLRCLAGVRTG